jgi:hypothetical protein
MTMSPFEILQRLVLWVGIGFSTGCVPLSPSPPAMPLAAGTQQAIGVQNDVVFPLQEGGAQIWFRRALDEDSEYFVQLGTLVGYGVFPYAGGGYRHYWIQPDSADGPGWSLGTEFSGGVGFWGQIAMPVSYKLARASVWLTTSPSVGFSYFGLLHVPLGASVRLGDHVQLNTQVGAWIFREFTLRYPRVYVTTGFSFPW